jgi:6 kDa early secretory antigenic target
MSDASMGSLKVETTQVINLAEQIRGGAKGITSQLEQLDAEVGKLRSSWSGAAQQAYDEAQRKWTQSLTEMNTLLGQIADTTENIAHGYHGQDQRSAGRFQLG